MSSKFFVCERCGNMAHLLRDAGVPMSCCGQPMKALEPNTVEASAEKHLPAVRPEGGTLQVTVGSVEHPMLPEHFIQWIWLETETGFRCAELKPGQAPTAVFALGDDRPVAVYEYCNLHGLWKTVL